MEEIIKNCDTCEFCKDHSSYENRLTVLEKKYDVVEDNTISINKLASKISLLLTIMSIIAMLVAAGALYTFTGINSFKETYAEDRIQLNRELAQMQQDNTKRIETLIENFRASNDIKLGKINDRLRTMETKIIKLETKIEK